MANRITMQQLQQQNQELQEQFQQQHGEIQNLTAAVNVMAQNVQATQASIQQLLANQAAEPSNNHPPNPPVNPAPIPPYVGQYTLEKFIKNGAKTFKGSTEPEMAEAWTLNMLKSFRAMEVPDNHWVRLASCMFEEEAAFWWEAAQRTNFVGRELESITWVEFIEAFNVTYYPEQVREQKSREFSNLEQGVMTVREYEQKFIQLERFAPGLCATEKARTSKFVWGLRFALKDRVAGHRARRLADAVTIACLAEEVLDEQFGSWKDKGKKKLEGTNGNTGKPAMNKKNNEGEKRKRNQEQQGDYDNPLCPHCNKHHTGECWKKTNKCFSCGEVGHFKKNCPKLQEKNKE